MSKSKIRSQYTQNILRIAKTLALFKIENAIVYLLSDIIYVFNLTFFSSFALEIVSFTVRLMSAEKNI